MTFYSTKALGVSPSDSSPNDLSNLGLVNDNNSTVDLYDGNGTNSSFYGNMSDEERRRMAEKTLSYAIEGVALTAVSAVGMSLVRRYTHKVPVVVTSSLVGWCARNVTARGIFHTYSRPPKDAFPDKLLPIDAALTRKHDCQCREGVHTLYSYVQRERERAIFLLE